MIASVKYTLDEIVERYPNKTISTASIISLDYALNNSYWNAVKISDSVRGIKTLTNNTNKKIHIISTNLAKLTN